MRSAAVRRSGCRRRPVAKAHVLAMTALVRACSPVPTHTPPCIMHTPMSVRALGNRRCGRHRVARQRCHTAQRDAGGDVVGIRTGGPSFAAASLTQLESTRRRGRRHGRQVRRRAEEGFRQRNRPRYWGSFPFGQRAPCNFLPVQAAVVD